MREFLGYTWVGWLNILLLQWLFIRVSYNKNKPRNYFIIVPVLPLTGWFTSFVPSKNKLIRIK